MGAAMEVLPARSSGLRASSLKRTLSLRARDAKILVEADGSVRCFDSLSERRSLFGFERLFLYKVQAGVVVQSQKVEWGVRSGPRAVQFSARIFDGIEMTQSLDFFQGSSWGYIRRVRLKNVGQGRVRLRLVDLSDPTAAQFGDAGRWGSLGLNAFNRGSHVAMDEVSDQPSARVIGASPQPAKFYMTTDRARAQDLVTSGELPDPTAGMSGQVLIISLHDIDVGAGESREISFASLYNPTRLEQALSDFGRLDGIEKRPPASGPLIACSSRSLTEASSWAVNALEGAQYSKDLLDRFDSMSAMAWVNQQGAKMLVEQARAMVRKDGSLPHSLDAGQPGVLESAVLLQALCRYLGLAQDKKLSRTHYPLVKKMATYLLSISGDFSVRPDPSLPQGWRRLLGKGYPSGEIPEVSLAVAAALACASQVARQVSKSDDAGRFRERSEMITEGVRKKLLDERGALALCLDPGGRLRADETIDTAVAAYRHPFLQSAEQSAAHRLLEKDFETQYGPRCVPKSNQVYFNKSYGRGQLGAFWTRAALAHANLCYRVGLSGIASLSLQKVAKLVTEDSIKLAGVPGEFPYWVDIEGGEIHGEDTDTVGAARFLEGLVSGEMGLSAASDKASLFPSTTSSLGWLLASDLWAGDLMTVFIGRAGGRASVFIASNKVACKEAMSFAKAETLELPAKGVYGVSFHGPGQVICLGNTEGSSMRMNVSFSPRGGELSRRLSTPLETYEPSKGSWTKVASLRVLPTMNFEASLPPNEWKAFRVSTL